jgi:hypothetical protein
MGANSGGSIAELGTGRGQIDLVIVEDLECVIQDCFDDTDLPPSIDLAICFGYVPAHSTSYINRGAIGYRPLILVIDQPSWAPEETRNRPGTD